MSVISTRAQTTIEVCLAIYKAQVEDGGAPVSCIDISVESGFSVSYIEQCVALLKESGIVVGTRGPGGGYSVRGDASLDDIIKEVDRNWRTVDPLPEVSHLRYMVDNFLKEITIAEIVYACRKKKPKAA